MGSGNGVCPADRKSAYVTTQIGKKIFKGLGITDHCTYAAVSDGHCAWRDGYKTPLDESTKKFLKGDSSAQTGTFSSDLSGKPKTEDCIDWTVPTLSGSLD